MPLSKRMLDLGLAALLVVPVGAVLCILAVLILIKDGRPVFFVSERMKTVDQGFNLWKLRTMKPAAQDFGVTGGDKADRLTSMGGLLRRGRLDELPQLWNVIRGDISFVGPRPPLRVYVERFPQLYREVLQSRPGITGLASLIYHRHEEHLIAACKTAQQTDHVYASRCVPAKAKLDLIYQKNWSLCFDMRLIWDTAARVLVRGK